MDARIGSAGADDGDGPPLDAAQARPRAAPGPRRPRPAAASRRRRAVVGDDELERSSPTSRAGPRSGATRAWRSAGPGRRAGRPPGRRSAATASSSEWSGTSSVGLAAASVDDGRRPPRPARPAAVATWIVSRVEPPVVTTSSTTSTRSASARLKPRRRRRTPSSRSAKIARTPSARATSWPMIRPPSAGDRTVGRPQVAHAVGQRAAERLGVTGMLQHERALQVARAVQAGRQPEMSFEQRGASGGTGRAVRHESCGRPPKQ